MKASRGVLIRDYLIYLLKLWMDGMKDAVLMILSTGALVIDLLSGGRRKRLFYSVMGLGERFDLWLNLHNATLRGQASEDGLFGGSQAGSNTLLGQLEQALRGGDEPRSRRGGRGGN